MRFSLISLALLISALTASQIAAAAELPSFESAAEKIQAATVTVRIGPAAKDSEVKDDGDKAEPRVTVFSGVSLGDGLLVTPLFTSTDARIRITLSGGEQAEATPLVLDEHSGLALLKISNKNVPGLPLADEPPKVGSWVMSAAAWGVEKPLVSLGIVAGVDRQLRGANYPPLLQCDLRTAETSSGAGVVNRLGELLGIVVAAQTEGINRGWTYAVPAQHIQRLLRVQADKSDKQKKKLLIVQDRRPVVGMVLGGEQGRIIVERIHKGSPAEKAGIKKGDLILETDGIKIRDVYQAVRPILYKRPGDKVTFIVQQQDARRSIDVVLGGGIVLPGAPPIDLENFFQKKVIIEGNVLDIARAAVKRDKTLTSAKNNEPGKKDIDPKKLLEKALERYLGVIAYQQKQIEAMQAEIEALKMKMGEPADTK